MPTGSRNAVMSAPVTSGRPGMKLGSMIVVRVVGSEMLRPLWPYARWMFNVLVLTAEVVSGSGLYLTSYAYP